MTFPLQGLTALSGDMKLKNDVIGRKFCAQEAVNIMLNSFLFSSGNDLLPCFRRLQKVLDLRSTERV